jgi:hypothetical protein
MDGVVWQEASFGQIHFGSACLGDARRTKRLIKVADQFMAHPGGTLPEKLKGWSDLMGLYRLVAARQVTHAAVIESHCNRTRAMAAARGGVVLQIHDTTELDYSHIPALKDQLGQVGNGGAFGYLCHNSLAVTPQREVLGLCSQLLHKRRQVPAGESPMTKRKHPERESRLWLAGCENSGAVPLGCMWVDIADCGSDTFEFLDYLHRQQRRYVIRCSKDRKLAGEDHVGADRIHRHLLSYTRDLPSLGEMTVKVKRQQKTRRKAERKPRLARVRLAAGPVSIAAPDFARGECQSGSLDLWVVHVREMETPPGTEPLEWVLLTNVAAENLEQARERVDWYSCRPMIEELHNGMKTGCQIESMQFEHADRLEPAIGLLSVVAAVLLQLREAARQKDADQQPATDVAPPLFVKVLSGWRYKEPGREMSVHEFYMALARLGGHLNRKHDGFPGWLTLWRGWQTLQLMIMGAEAITSNCV